MWTYMWLIWWLLNRKITIFKTMIEWISDWKLQDLKHLLGEDMNIGEIMAILWEQKKLMLYQGALYQCHTLGSKLEEIFQFVVFMAHWVAAMNRCHYDAGHQGQQWTLYLLQDPFWWSSMVTLMQRVTSNCRWCIQYKGTHAKVSMQATIATTPLKLLHVDSTSIEMSMELDQPPYMVIILVFYNHFMKYIMAYVTPYQTVRTPDKFLWKGYISIFGAPAKLLSD